MFCKIEFYRYARRNSRFARSRNAVDILYKLLFLN